MIEYPTLIVSTLATALPAQATYFMQISFATLVFTGEPSFLFCFDTVIANSHLPILIVGGMELLRLYPIIMAILRSFIGPRLTEKEKRKTFFWFRPLYDPEQFRHADYTAGAVSFVMRGMFWFQQQFRLTCEGFDKVLLFMILMVYTVVSPLTNFIIAFVCLGFGTITRYQFIYVYPTVPDSGGMIWMSFIKIVVTCMIVAQLTSE